MAQVRPVLSIKDSEVTSSECFLGLLFPQMLNCSDKLFKQGLHHFGSRVQK